MRKQRYIFIITAVLLLIFVCACAGGEVDATPSAMPDTAVQPTITEEPTEEPLEEATEEPTVEPTEEPPAQISIFPT